ncbi:glycosyl hydrolase family 18 protein [Frigoribacterium sp. 2-23]|uniref:glycosyl hydrolase family 18 protein n=1 Tax=Frigoribacterium sp. 2-23 TaxID=3415006 RepID=UPI003C6EA7AD
MRTALTSLAAGAVALALTVALAGCSGDGVNHTVAPTATIPSGLSVEGYVVASSAAVAGYEKSKAAIDLVGVDGVTLTAGGAGVTPSSETANAVRTAAQKGGAKAELLVANFDDTTSDFSGELASAMLNDEQNRQLVIAGLAAEVVNGGWDGVQLDFESLPGAVAPSLTAFASELRATLPATATISMAVQAATTPEGYAALGYDLQGLGDSVDRFVLMAYDQHGAGFSEPGAVGGLPWTTRAVEALVTLVPAAKVDLGVANYGYQWTGEGKAGAAVTVAQARKAAQSTGRWDDSEQEYTASPPDGSTIWWSDGRSITARAELAKEKGLHGVAIWQLTTGDPVRR